MWNREPNKKGIIILQNNIKFLNILYTYTSLTFEPFTDEDYSIDFAWKKVHISIKEWSILSGESTTAIRTALLFLKKYNIIFPDKTVNEIIYKLCSQILYKKTGLSKLIDQNKKGE